MCISSIATQFTSVQDAAFGYSGAKAALEAWAAGMAVEDGPQGVRINNVRPGVTVTAVWESAREAMGAGNGGHGWYAFHVMMTCRNVETVEFLHTAHFDNVMKIVDRKYACSICVHTVVFVPPFRGVVLLFYLHHQPSNGAQILSKCSQPQRHRPLWPAMHPLTMWLLPCCF